MVLATARGRFEEARLDSVFATFPILREKWHQPAGSLSGGQKQMLAVGRAIIEERRLLVVDEPTKGLAPAVIQHMIAAFQRLKAARTTILLVEQNFHMARSLGDDVAVMDDGRIVHHGLDGRSRGGRSDADAPARPQPGEPSMRARSDWAALLIVPVIALLALPSMSFSTWLTLTVAGVAMGMMLFLMASGLTLIFGLMDVLNFAHGAFITLGRVHRGERAGRPVGLGFGDDVGLNLAALGVAILVAAVASGAAGALFERLIIRRVYGSHLRQILITVGGLIIAEQLVIAAWGAEPLTVAKPAMLRGSVVVAGAAIETYRIAVVVLGLVLFAAISLVLNRTRIGLLVRAGVENREMVEALGFHIRRLFVGVFVAGTALAGIGGVTWAGYQEQVTPSIGSDMTILVFIVVIIGGLGSVAGCFAAAVLVGLVANYAGFLAPKLALGSNIALMVAVLLWRPRGLFPVAKQ